MSDSASIAFLVIIASISLQVLAAIQAFRLIRVTGWRGAWTMIAVALLLMAGRRAVSLLHTILNDRPLDLAPELLALAISALMLVGVDRISTLLRAWRAVRDWEQTLAQAQQDFITATDPFRAGAFHRLARGLAEYYGWADTIIGLRDIDGQPRLLGVNSLQPDMMPHHASSLLAEGWRRLKPRGDAAAAAMIELEAPGRRAVAFPVLAGNELTGLVIFIGESAAKPAVQPKGLDAAVLAVGGMIGALGFERERQQGDRDLRRLIAELERSNKELEEFAYISSHDMQEPLRMVILYLELLLRRYGDHLDAPAREYVDFAVEGAQRMHTMIIDLLEYCRLGHQDPDHDVAASARAALDLAAHHLATRDFELVVPEPLPDVHCSQMTLGRIFLNLLSNAVKFRHSDRKPYVTVTAHREGDWWHFGVADNGIGIAPQYFDKIFQVFQRLHGRGEYDGTGIGLAFVKKAVEGAGGRVWVDSTAGTGSTFHFTLPAVPEPR
jgi:signal transduction histidine kinase